MSNITQYEIYDTSDINEIFEDIYTHLEYNKRDLLQLFKYIKIINKKLEDNDIKINKILEKKMKIMMTFV